MGFTFKPLKTETLGTPDREQISRLRKKPEESHKMNLWSERRNVISFVSGKAHLMPAQTAFDSSLFLLKF